jgi:ketosteroid isomerase-like protein
MDQLAGRFARALESGDVSDYEDLLAPDARWGAPGDPAPPCQSRRQVLAWYQNARAAGVRARVTETLVTGDRIVLSLKVTGRDDGESGPGAEPGVEEDRWQVLTVKDGQIAEITGFDTKAEAVTYAG